MLVIIYICLSAAVASPEACDKNIAIATLTEHIDIGTPQGCLTYALQKVPQKAKTLNLPDDELYFRVICQPERAI